MSEYTSGKSILFCTILLINFFFRPCKLWLLNDNEICSNAALAIGDLKYSIEMMAKFEGNATRAAQTQQRKQNKLKQEQIDMITSIINNQSN